MLNEGSNKITYKHIETHTENKRKKREKKAGNFVACHYVKQPRTIRVSLFAS